MGLLLQSVLIMMVLAVLIGLLSDSLKSRTEKEEQERHRDIVEKHKEMLAVIDECPNPLVRRERKAQLETMINSGVKETDGIDYLPDGIKEVTTPEERRARREAERAGRKYVHTLTRKQAEEIADELAADFISSTGETRKDLARIFPKLGDAWAKTYAEWCDIDMKDARFAVDQIQSVLNTDKQSALNTDKIKDIDMIPVESSSVRFIGYDPENEKLYVKFTSGATYEYDDVPASVYDSFMESPSKGRFVNNVLTCLYNYRPTSGNRK